MKKITVIAQEKDAAGTLEDLRALGVLHVEHAQAPKGEEISNLQENIALLQQALGILTAAPSRGEPRETLREPFEWKHIASHIVELRKRYEQLKEYGVTLAQSIDHWKAWGDFDPQRIMELQEKNIFLKLYQIPRKQLVGLPPDVCVRRISVQGDMLNCAVISMGKKELSFKEINLPKMSLGRMQQKLNEDRHMMQVLSAEIAKHARYSAHLLETKRRFEKSLELQEALRGMGEAGEIVFVKGYAPFDAVEVLQKTALRKQWGFLTEDPSENDTVPTLVRNPRWVSIISPVFKMIEVVPGYAELDISLWFLIFFSVFFGMLIGDAGYGLIYIALTFFAQRKFGCRMKSQAVFTLFYLLSGCAVIWGALSATFFGQEWLPASVKPLLPMLRTDKGVQTLCFFLGALHLSIAHSWRAILKFPAVIFLADLGWICVLWAAFFMARFLILQDSLPAFTKWLLWIGPVLVVFFSDPKKNILKGIGSGLGTLLLNLMNNFTDVVSYIRLFAVGLAGVAVADAFNAMAAAIGFNSFLSGLATSLILIVGHLLNVILGPLSVLVHGVRLNVLEFCTHINIQWSGFNYKPLRE